MDSVIKSSLQRKIEIGNWFVLLLTGLVSFVFLPREFFLGIFFGGLISILNFHWLAKDVRGIINLFADGVPHKKAKRFVIVRYQIRLLLTGVALYFIITRMSADVIGLLIGLSMVVVNSIVTVVLGSLKKNPKEVQKKRCIPCYF